MKTEYQEIKELKSRVGSLEAILHDVLGALKDDAFFERRVPMMITHYGTLHDRVYGETDDGKITYDV